MEMFFFEYLNPHWGTRREWGHGQGHYWLEHWASNRKVAGSIPWADKGKISRAAPEQDSSHIVPRAPKTWMSILAAPRTSLIQRGWVKRGRHI